MNNYQFVVLTAKVYPGFKTRIPAHNLYDMLLYMANIYTKMYAEFYFLTLRTYNLIHIDMFLSSIFKYIYKDVCRTFSL